MNSPEVSRAIEYTNFRGATLFVKGEQQFVILRSLYFPGEDFHVHKLAEVRHVEGVPIFDYSSEAYYDLNDLLEEGYSFDPSI